MLRKQVQNCTLFTRKSHGQRQLQKLNVDAATKRGSRLSVSEWVSIFQLLTVLGAGIWTFYVFTRYDAQEKEQAQKKRMLELKKLEAVPLKATDDIVIDETGFSGARRDPRYAVNYTYSIENTSDYPVQIRLISIHAFAFKVPKVKPGVIVEIPPLTPEGQGRWTKLFTKGFVVDSERVDGGELITLDGTKVTPDIHGGTGLLDSGESSTGAVTLIMHKGVGDYVGFRSELTVKLEDGQERVLYLSRYMPLSTSSSEERPASLVPARPKKPNAA